MTLDGVTLLDAIPKPAAVFDAAMLVVSANPQFTRLFHHLNRNPEKLTAAIEDNAALRASVQHAIETLSSGARTAEFRWTGPAPDSLEFVGHASRADSDHFVLVLDHVSDQVESEQIFTVILEYLDGVLNQLPLGVIVMNGDLRVTFYNRSQMTLFTSLGLELSMLEVIRRPGRPFLSGFRASEMAKAGRGGSGAEGIKHPHENPVPA